MKKNIKAAPTDVAGLRKMVLGLTKVPDKKLDDAICDIIDIGGFSLAVLVDTLWRLPGDIQFRAVRKIEDFCYFHPENGKKVFARLKKVMDKIDPACQASLFAAMADVVEQLEDNDLEASRLGETALSILESQADLARKAKALEILVKSSNIETIPLIIKNMIKAVSEIDKYQNYQFIESALLALKRLGGEEIIKLLINPNSLESIKKIRIEWRSREAKLLDDTMAIVRTLDTDFAQVMLKVIDLSEFNLPFVAMIKEGLEHTDKWVRQTAAEAMHKAAEALNPEALSRLLNDSAGEVRLMATSSLGGFSAEKTGEILENLAGQQGESLEIRLNALYALHAQKNLAALKKLAAAAESLKIAVNAQGLAALLMPHEEGRKTMLKAFLIAKSEAFIDAGHYLMDILDPDDIEFLIQSHSEESNETYKERIIIFLKQFVSIKAGPKLDLAVSKLSEGQQKAISMLK